MLMEYFDNYARTYRPYKGGAFCYEDGCVYRGLELLHQSTGDERWLAHLLRLITPQILAGPRLAGYDPNDYNIDNILSGRALLYLHEVTGDRHYLTAANCLVDQLAFHPRTKSGVYWHKLRYPWQIWLDGLYMCAPFQIGYGWRAGRPDLVADTLKQLNTALLHTEVPATGLYAHAVDEARRQQWADQITGQTRAHWARSLGWLAMTLVDVAELVGPAAFQGLKARTERLLSDIANLRRPESLWLQVIDRPDLEDNYIETSASAMFVYALQKGHMLGLWKGQPEGLTQTLIQTALQPNGSGGHEMVDICKVAGLGMFEGHYRDGTAEYYLSEKRTTDDAKGVGPLMMSVATSCVSKEKTVSMASG